MAQRVGVLGARGFTGSVLVQALRMRGCEVAAFARELPDVSAQGDAGLSWQRLEEETSVVLDAWVCTAPIWELHAYFPLIEASGARRLVALSSTSCFSKAGSADSQERELVQNLIRGEEQVQQGAQARGISWVILRPTMIYGCGRDHNVSSLLRVIRRFGFLPLLGRAVGLRQPIHVEDVAQACIDALFSGAAANRAYNLSGGETLSYRQLCERLFHALGRHPRLASLPLCLFRLVKPLIRFMPRRLRWLADMVERMNQDLVFDHGDAARDLNFRPRPFELSEDDLVDRSNRIVP